MKLSLLSLVSIALSTSQSSAVTALYYKPGPTGSYIAQNGGQLYSGSTWTFTDSRRIYPNSSAIAFGVTSLTGEQRWNISIQAPNNGLLQTGSYLAHRFPFQQASLMGFDFSVGSRGLNTSTSRVNVLEVEYSADKITKLAVDFIQFEETWNSITLSSDINRHSVGSFRFSSDIPLTIPEPSSLLLVSIATCSLIGFRRR